MRKRNAKKADAFDTITGEMAIHSRKGNREALDKLFASLVETMENRDPDVIWLDYPSWEKVPLGMLETFDPEILELLDSNGYRFTWELDRASDMDLLPIRNMTIDRIRKARDHVEQIKARWLKSRRSDYRPRCPARNS